MTLESGHLVIGCILSSRQDTDPYESFWQDWFLFPLISLAEPGPRDENTQRENHEEEKKKMKKLRATGDAVT